MAEKKKGGKPKGDYVAVIKGYTDSVQKIGADAALMGLIVILGFGALAVGADASGVSIFAIVVWTAWTVTKFLNAYLEVIREQTKLDTTRTERGQKILEAHPDRQRRLSLNREDRKDGKRGD